MAAHVSYPISRLIERCAGSLRRMFRRLGKNWVDALREAAGWSPENANVENNWDCRIARQFSWTKTAERTLAILNSYRD